MEVEAAMQIPEERRGEGVTLRAVREEGTLAGISIKYIDALSDDHFTSLNGSSKHKAIYISIQKVCLDPPKLQTI